MPSYSPVDVSDVLRKLGVTKGDCVFVHMGLKRLGTLHHQGDLFPDLFEAFSSVVGPAGTIVVPTFNFGFCKGQDYDVAHTKSEGMGQFAEYVRRRPDARRSKHPFQSIAAVGKDADEITQSESITAFSADSCFSKMVDKNAAIIFYGVPFVETFVHVAEERAKVDYRYWIKFRGNIISDSVAEAKEIDFFARKLDIVPEPRIDNDFLADHLSRTGILIKQPIGDGYISMARTRDLVDHLEAMLALHNRFALQR